MVRTNPKVGNQTVDFLHAVIFKEILEIHKVTSNESKSIIVKSILHGISILVERIEVSALGKVT